MTNYIGEMTEWISVEDRLPGKYDISLICLDTRYIATAYRIRDPIGGNVYWFYPGDNEAIKQEVTHWMPLPDPPEVNDD